MEHFCKTWWIFRLYFRICWGDENVWVTTPFGIMVPRHLWDTNLWKLDAWAPIRAHELVHYQRMRNRPYFSRLWWAFHYIISGRMAYEEEILGFRAEIAFFTGPEYRAWYIKKCARILIHSYGVKKSEEEIIADLST